MTEILEGSCGVIPIPWQFWIMVTFERQCELLNGAPFRDEETALVLRLSGRLH